MNPAEFLDTLRTDVLSPERYLDSLDRSFQELQPKIPDLMLASSAHDIEELLSDRRGRRLIRLLLGSRGSHLTPTEILFELDHLRRDSPESFEAVVYGVLLADSRVGQALERRRTFRQIIQDSLGAALSGQPDLDFAATTRFTFGSGQSREFEFLVRQDRTLLVAVVTIFQTIAGGRNQREFATLVDLQESLAEERIGLIVAADGPGFRSMANTVLMVGAHLRFLTNLTGIQKGDLAEFVNELAHSSQPPPVRRDERLIPVVDLLLKEGTVVTARELGIDDSEMSSFLLRYEAVNADLQLVRPTPDSLTTQNARLVEAVRTLSDGSASARRSIESSVCSVHEALGWTVEARGRSDGMGVFALDTSAWQLRFPDPTPVFWALDPARTSGSYEAQARELLSRGPIVGRIGILVDPHTRGKPTPRTREIQGLAGQVATLDSETLVALLIRTSDAAKEKLMEALLSQVDLNLVSPFLSEGPTTESMFYGREPQIRRILEQVRHQSFAFVGGRRSGKTSLLHGIQRRLQDTLPVHMLDCQAHPTRRDFLSHLARDSGNLSWMVEDDRYAEQAISDYLFTVFGTGFGVLLLDEVDQLFESDAEASEYPHLLSSALRSLVQLGRLSVVVTGERQLHRLTLDPSSPHWNFCTPILVGPLEHDEAARLMREPLDALLLSTVPEAIELVVESCAEHPNLVQFFGSQLIDRLTREGTSARNVDLETVEEVASSPEFRNRFITTFWSQSTALEKVLSIELLFEKPRTSSQLQGQLETHGIQVTATEIEDALTYLRLYAIAQESPAGSSTRSPAFERHFGALRGSPLQAELIAEAAI